MIFILKGKSEECILSIPYSRIRIIFRESETETGFYTLYTLSFFASQVDPPPKKKRKYSN